MKANLTNLRKALSACAKSHNAKLSNWVSEGQLGINSETPATICDVQLICDAFFGHHGCVEPGYGYTTVWLGSDYLPSVDEATMYLALPYGTAL